MASSPLARPARLVAGAVVLIALLGLVGWDVATDHLPRRLVAAAGEGGWPAADAVLRGHRLTTLPSTEATDPALRAAARGLVDAGAPATAVIRRVLSGPEGAHRGAVSQALIDDAPAPLAGETLAVLARSAAEGDTPGDPAPLLAALDRSVAELSADEAGPVLAAMMSVPSPLADRAAHHFDARPPRDAPPLLQTLLLSAATHSERVRLAQSLLRLADDPTVWARLHNTLRRADLVVGLAVLEADARSATTPALDPAVVGDFGLRLHRVPPAQLGGQEKFPPALLRYPEARTKLLDALAGAPSEPWTALARALVARGPQDDELQAILTDITAGHLAPGVLRDGLQPAMQTTLVALMEDERRDLDQRTVAAALLVELGHAGAAAFVAAHPVPAGQ